MHTDILWDNMKESDNLEDLGVVGNIIPKWSVKKLDAMTWSGFASLRVPVTLIGFYMELRYF